MGKKGTALNDSPPLWLTNDFLQAVLRAGDGDPTICVASFHAVPATSKGDNFLGVLYRVTVSTTTGNQRQLILKCLPVGLEQESFIRDAKLFDIEIEMYTKTLPKMYELLKEKYPSFKPMTAKYLYSDINIGVIVLEDLLATGFKMAKRQKGLDLNHCLLVLQSLATFHAASVALQAKCPSSMDSYKEGVFKEKTRPYLGIYFTSSVHALMAEMQKWPDCHGRYSEKLQFVVDNWWDILGPTLDQDEDGFNVLNHGDLWVNNMMFQYSPPDLVEAVKFLDMQIVHFTSPVVDLLYFFYTSPSDDVRQKNFDQLIQTYHENLVEALNKLDCAQKAPTLEKLHQDLKKRMSYALFPVLSELPNMLAEKDDVFDIGGYFSGDEDGASGNKTFGGAEYKKVIQRLLPIFESSGVI